mgnify:FL=1
MKAAHPAFEVTVVGIHVLDREDAVPKMRALLDAVRVMGNSGGTGNGGLAMLLAAMGLRANNEGVALTVPGASTDRLLDAVAKIGEMTDLDPVRVLAEAKNILREKWDWTMPEELLRKSFGSLNLELDEACRFAASFGGTR